MAFQFKQFRVDDSRCAMKVGTDGVLLGAWTAIEPGCRFIVDAGTGSGLVSLMLAQRAPETSVLGFDIDAYAIDDARANFAASPFASRLEAKVADVVAFMPSVQPDLIVCNPPFFAAGLKSPDRQRDTARSQGSLSPFSIIDWAARFLSPCGSLAMVTPTDEEAEILFHAELRRLHLWRQCKVSTVEGRQACRILWQFSRAEKPQELTSLTVRRIDGSYTEDYICLTRDFYLNM